MSSQKLQGGFWGFSATLYPVNFHKGLKHWVVTCAFCRLSLFLTDPFSKVLSNPSEADLVLNPFLICPSHFTSRFLYNRMGYWSDWSIPILVTTAAGFTYITMLLVSRMKSPFLEVCVLPLKRSRASQAVYKLSNFPSEVIFLSFSFFSFSFFSFPFTFSFLLSFS